MMLHAHAPAPGTPHIPHWIESAPEMFEAVHWQLRTGFCRCLDRLRRCNGTAALEHPLRDLLRLVEGFEMLYEAEQEALSQLRCQPDSSLANRDLLWAAIVLRQKVADVRNTAHDVLPDRLQDLLRYLALFTGELLVQLHAKDADVQTLLRQQLSARALQQLADDIAGVATFLSP